MYSAVDFGNASTVGVIYCCYFFFVEIYRDGSLRPKLLVQRCSYLSKSWRKTSVNVAQSNK